MKRVKFVNSSNTKYKYFEGTEGALFAKSGGSASFYPDSIPKYLVTSVIDVITISQKLITLKTLNSTYTFELTKDSENEA
jgi:hypothetical protein